MEKRRRDICTQDICYEYDGCWGLVRRSGEGGKRKNQVDLVCVVCAWNKQTLKEMELRMLLSWSEREKRRLQFH